MTPIKLSELETYINSVGESDPNYDLLKKLCETIRIAHGALKAYEDMYVPSVSMPVTNKNGDKIYSLQTADMNFKASEALTKISELVDLS